MSKNICTTLNFTVSIKELQNYYSILKEDFESLNWSWNKCGNTIIKQWLDAAHKDPANLLTNGWAIQSNLVNLDIPCPPWNISTHETTNYRNTKLAFGIIKKLQEFIPFSYRWSVSVQPPGGKVSLHSDHEDELTVWIPIYTDNTSCINFIHDDTDEEIILKSDGHAYLLDTTIPHYTLNKGTTERSTIIFRINKINVKDLLNLKGNID